MNARAQSQFSAAMVGLGTSEQLNRARWQKFADETGAHVFLDAHGNVQKIDFRPIADDNLRRFSSDAGNALDGPGEYPTSMGD